MFDSFILIAAPSIISRSLFPPQMRSARVEDQAKKYRHMHPLNEKYGTLIIGTLVGINQVHDDDVS